jgi:hypothetical protein
MFLATLVELKASPPTSLVGLAEVGLCQSGELLNFGSTEASFFVAQCAKSITCHVRCLN